VTHCHLQDARIARLHAGEVRYQSGDDRLFPEAETQAA